MAQLEKKIKLGSQLKRLMMYIPEEIIMEILSRLPVKSILKFRCVCKRWYEFLKHNTEFVKMQLSNSIRKNNFRLLFTKYEVAGIYSVDYDQSSARADVVQIDAPFIKGCYQPVEIFGYCNGLFFIRIAQDHIIGMWNPGTKEYKIAPMSKTTPTGFETIYSKTSGIVKKYGFGYDHKTDDYKLVTIVTPYCIPKSEVEVYTLSSNSWRRIAYIPYRIMRGPPGVFVNGASHWLADPYPVRSNNKFSQVLLSFNMAEEVFSELPQLEIFNDNHKYEHKRMDVLEGFLCMLCSHSRVGFEVWMMTSYGVRDSWTKHYAISQSKIDMIPSFRYLRRLHSLKDGEILLEILLDTWKYAALIVYDPNRERARLLNIDLEKCEQWRDPYNSHLKVCFHMQTYVESLVSLHTGTYVGGGQEESDLEKALDIARPSDESD